MRLRRASHVALALALVATPLPALAGEGRGISLLRDSETEKFLRDVSNPIFQAAGLDVTATHIYIVNDSTINAFAAAGQNMFMNTGTINAAQVPNELIGVIAHETGHIAGGHITRTAESIGKIQTPMLLGMLLGVGAMIAGAPDAGAAIMTGAQTIGERSFLMYSRQQEARADEAGLRYLTATHQSGEGLLDFFARLHNEEILTARKIDPFAQSHPLSGERLRTLTEQVEKSPYRNAEDRPELVAQLKLVQGKIHGFLDGADAVLRRYPPKDKSAPARYARAVAYYRVGQLAEGLNEVNSLIAESPQYAYFHELKGQMLFESGKVSEAVDPYRTAASLLPHDGLIHMGLGQALLSAAETQRDPKLVDESISVLKTAVKEDQDLPMAWNFLAEAYSTKNDTAMAQLATAEFNYSTGNLLEAARFAIRARDKLSKGSVSYNRANDIIHLAQNNMPKKGRRQQGQ